jgi:hypothetical protein
LEIDTTPSDFWWLSHHEGLIYENVELFHQEPYSDSHLGKQPYSCHMESDGRYGISGLDLPKAKFRNTNVFRSVAVYSMADKACKGPVVFDVDRCPDGTLGYEPDLPRALQDTKRLFREYFEGLQQPDYRIIFSGHKGFHIEIRPSALGIGLDEYDENKFGDLRQQIDKRLGKYQDHSFVDKFHPHLRLHNSVNSWFNSSGSREDSMTFVLSSEELFELNINAIVAKSRTLTSIDGINDSFLAPNA